ncbi:MAG: pilin [bacterium]
MKILKKILVFFTVAFFATNIVLAANLKDAFDPTGGNSNNPLDSVAVEAGYDNTKSDVDPIIQNVISIILSFLGVIFLILTIYAGYLWMTAQGDPKKVEQAKDILTRAVIGLIIVVSSYTLSSYVITKFASQGLDAGTIGNP